MNANDSSPRVQVYLGTAVAALGGLLFGYDTAVISGAIGFVQAHFDLNAVETGWAASCALAGCALGAIVAGALGDRLGRRNVLIVSAVLFLVSALGTALAGSFSAFVIYRALGGAGIGAASFASPLYIAEIAPARWRGRLVAVNQLAIVLGILLIYFVNYLIAAHGNESWNQATGWRWMFASGALPALLLLGLLFVIVESPRFLAARGRLSEARRAAALIHGAAGDAEIDAVVAEVRGEQGPPIRLFTPPMRRLTLIGIVLAVLQQVTGINVFLYYAPEIFKHLGAGSQAALWQTVLVGAANLLFTFAAMAFVDRLGRKPLLIGGSIGMGLCLVAMGVAAWHQAFGLSLLGFILGYVACFALSVGPVTWILLAEIFPLQIRGRAMGTATVALWIANFVVSQTFPMLDQNPVLVGLFHHAFPFFFYAGFCAIEAVFVWRCLPETKNRSLEEIGASFLRGRSVGEPAVAGVEGRRARTTVAGQ
jgi:sugar porter (SP) family MFS transporter